jgi:hypothetical protein
MADAINEITKSANDELVRVISRVDASIRPLQRAYFKCSYGCSDDSRLTAEVPACFSRCQEPMSGVAEQMTELQNEFQSRIKLCHKLAAGAIPGGGRDRQYTDADYALYADRLRPCVREEVANLPSLVKPLTAAVPQAIATIGALTPLSAANIDGKKSAWW